MFLNAKQAAAYQCTIQSRRRKNKKGKNQKTFLFIDSAQWIEGNIFTRP